MNHMEWDINYADVQRRLELRKEHNATVRAYRDAMAECDRLGKANDDACDNIYALKATVDEHSAQIKALESRPALTWEECEAKFHEMCGYWPKLNEGEYLDWLQSRLPAPTDSIRVPFSDAQIERMAHAACESWHGLPSYTSYHDAGKQEWRSAIRAALAAGGLEPCAVPEYAPEDVALNKAPDPVYRELEQLRDRLARVSAKSARRASALKECHRGIARLRTPHNELYKVAHDKFQMTLSENTRLREEIERLNASAIVPVPERASDEELAEYGAEYAKSKGLCTYGWSDYSESNKAQSLAWVAAVRAHVEAPLLNKLVSANNKIKRQADELTKLYHLRQGDAGERDAIRAELEAANAEREGE